MTAKTYRVEQSADGHRVVVVSNEVYVREVFVGYREEHRALLVVACTPTLEEDLAVSYSPALAHYYATIMLEAVRVSDAWAQHPDATTLTLEIETP